MTKTSTRTNTAGVKRPRRMARPADADVGTPVSSAENNAAGHAQIDNSSSPVHDPTTAPVPTKASTVLALLRREDGATLPELVAATGWQPHTTRAHLTGLRKKGHTIERTRRDDAPCYRVVEAG